MEKELIVKEYMGNKIEFKMVDGEVYANANQMVNGFGGSQKLSDWKRSAKTKEYIGILSKNKLWKNPIVSEEGRNGGTWIHEKLILNLARYCNTEFEIWCDEILQQIKRDIDTATHKKEDNMNNLTNKQTLTSLELVEQINIFRKEEGNRKELRHDTMLGIIRDEFGEEVDGDISLQNILESTYRNERGREYLMFILTLNQSKQILMRESKFVRKHMIAYIEKLENALKEISNKDRLLLGLFSKDPMVVADSHKQLVALELKPLQDKIEQDKPLVEFANQVSNNSDLILVREFAKLLADENIKIGEKRLYQWFRDNGFVLKDKTEPVMVWWR